VIDPKNFVYTALGELTHLAGIKSNGGYLGSVGYGDDGLARAAFIVNRRMGKNVSPPPVYNPNLNVSSPYYHNALEIGCGKK
jgi:hypothetical protein